MQMEPFYPLLVFVCQKCFLVQIEEFESPEGIFSDYLYFSSFSDSWLAHASRYVDMMVARARQEVKPGWAKRFRAKFAKPTG